MKMEVIVFCVFEGDSCVFWLYFDFECVILVFFFELGGSI